MAIHKNTGLGTVGGCPGQVIPFLVHKNRTYRARERPGQLRAVSAAAHSAAAAAPGVIPQLALQLLDKLLIALIR